MWLWLSAPSALLFSSMSALSPAAALGVTCSLESGLLQGSWLGLQHGLLFRLLAPQLLICALLSHGFV